MSMYLQRIENGHQVAYLCLQAASNRYGVSKAALISLLNGVEPLEENGQVYYTEKQYQEALTPPEPDGDDEAPAAA